MKSGELYGLVMKLPSPPSERSFRNYVTELENLGFIETEDARENKGKTRIIKLAWKLESFEKLINT
jgi:Cdc6-like AAA superfamily ATPase